AAAFVAVIALGGFNGHEPAPAWWLTLLALVVIAVTVLPVHAWLRVHVDRLVYDWHDDPYAVLSEVAQRLGHEQDRSPDGIIPTIAATIAATLRLPYVAIETDPDDGARTTTYGAPPPRAELLTVPLAFRGVAIGTLHAAARRPGEALSADDRRLLHDLARQVGITLHAARLSDALRVSREELVSAREEERRRIRRDLHDSLGPTLASLRMQLGAVRRVLREEPAEAEALIDGLRDDVRAATAEIRRLVYDLRPPLLDELGLDGALRGLGAVAAPATLTLELPATLPPLGAAVEVALYRIAAEAVHNVAKHARAASCVVRLEDADGALTLTIRDDGVGPPAERGVGVGLTSMRERAAELGGSLILAAPPGGGACVTAILPRRHAP
ncbi:MAG TPA: GAF domain-containing sensor histidine kinase, partial [Thermomicrobiales bacterium]|nr:GAF domain-containing sensor histidine kinase [Thermomicrobiales bacterium]